MDLKPSVAPINESMEMNVIETARRKSNETHGATVESHETTAVFTETQMPSILGQEEERPVVSIGEKLRKTAVMSGLFVGLLPAFRTLTYISRWRFIYFISICTGSEVRDSLH